jgi:hypothetical protein
MQIIDTRTPFWVFICEYADKPYQDILFDSDRDLLIVRSLSTGPAKTQRQGSIGMHPASLRHEERKFALRRLWSLRANA